ncbi:MAG: hypothetical protein V1663_04970 [archaeon]
MLDSFNKLTSSKEFKEWRSKHKESYLCSCFKIMGDKDLSWQFDFYNKNNTITSFTTDPIEITENQEIFQKEKTKLKELDLKKINLNIDNSLKKIKEKYKQDHFIKIVIILQPDCWNITLLSSEFKVLNVKLDIKTQKITDEKYESVLNFKTK